MEEILKAAFAESVSLHDFFMVHVPKIHEANLDNFSRWTQETLIVSFEMRDTGQRYTLAFNPTDCEVEDDEMIDFPIATIICDAEPWDVLKSSLLELTLALDANSDRLESQYKASINAKLLKEFERKFEGVVSLIVLGAKDIEAPLRFDIVLNDYVPNTSAPSFELRINASNIRDLVHGNVKPRELKDSVKVVGQMKLALDLIGFFSTHFEL